MSLRHARGMASTFVPLGVQLEEEEAEESQPIRDKVRVEEWLLSVRVRRVHKRL